MLQLTAVSCTIAKAKLKSAEVSYYYRSDLMMANVLSLATRVWDKGQSRASFGPIGAGQLRS